MTTHDYFAYGSNMLSSRLLARVPSARLVGRATLSGHRLCFHKRSWRDGTGKCGIIGCEEPAALVHGVVWEVPASDLARLDAVEGVGAGYERAAVRVRLLRSDDPEVEALTYVPQATHLDEGLVPFEWYRDLVLHGALEHGFPEAYVEAIRAVRVAADADESRAALHRALIEELGR